MNIGHSQPASKPTDWRFTLFALGVLASAILFVFGRPLFTEAAFFPPADGAPFFDHDRQIMTLQSLWGAWGGNALGSGRILALVPARLLAILFPPQTGHILRFIGGTALLAVATAFFLHGRGFRKHALWLPAIGLAFSGYFFTLVSAGHGGFFEMTPFAVFVFGCADRGFRHRSPYWFGWAGVCAALGLTPQPDMMALYGVLALVYGIFLFFEQRPKPAAAPGAWAHYLRALGVGAVVAAGLAAAVAASGLARATHVLETRERVRGETAEEQWEFATNWSMPPEELLDLVAPFVYGIETGDPDGPYWGRVGRSLNWRETRQGLMNLKQHSLYLGLIPLIFGFYALVGSVFEKRRHRRHPPRDAASQDGQSIRQSALPFPGWPREVWFWAAAFGVSVILAMGRFTPFYRLFYALPFFSRIRAPVKFIHLAELALAVLFAYGLALFLSTRSANRNTAAAKETAVAGKRNESRERSSSRPGKRHADKAHTAAPVAAGQRERGRGMALLPAFAAGCGLLGILFGITAVILPSLTSLHEYWRDIGFGAYTGLLAGVMRGGLLRATLLSFLAAAVFALPLFNLRFTRPILLCVLWITVTVDMTTVGRRYVRTGDLDPWYNRNPVADRVLADADLGRLSFHLGPSVRRNWTFGNLLYHGVDTLQPAIGDLGMPEIYQRFFGALQNHPIRLWEITNTRYVLGSREQFARLIEHPAFSEVMSFDLRGGRFIPQGHDGPYVLLHFQAATPRAAVYVDWEVAEPDEALRRLADPQFPVRHRVVVSDEIPLPDEDQAAATEPGRADITRYGRTRIEIEAQSPAPGLLLLKDRYDPRWRVTVNGEPANVLRCNFMMRGIRIPAGESTVRMVFRPNLPYFLISLAGILVMLGWWGVRVSGLSKSGFARY